MQKNFGQDAVPIYGSGSLSNEEAYLLGKFARTVLKTKPIDYNGRYCMAAAATAMNQAFGLDRGSPFPAEDIAHTDFLILVGSNVAECQPTLLQYLQSMRIRGGILAVLDPRESKTGTFADLHVQLVPGSDLALIKGLICHWPVAGMT
ncbi:MAG: molybdopterin-dependent oxidoreductase [Acidibacillus sp.]|nr:molybdopterin-dependent oxidoreductase [Acidibacillus sp.]